MTDQPELSIVVTSRNDDHGGNLKKRMRLCFNGILALSARHKLKCELIIVEWNPPAGKPKLADVLPWPGVHPYCTVRIIEVPPELHNRYKHAAGLPLYQMIAKNVGIRRARGRMVLATNIDILFTDAMFAFLASGAAHENVMYRADRHDTDGDIPEDADIDTQLRIAKETTLRVCGRNGTLNLRTGAYSIVNPTFADPGDAQGMRYPIHTNACGDFTLMARKNWFELKGHWELDIFSFHLDSLLCYAAVYGGLEEVCLGGALWLHHIEHTAGWTPEIEAAGTMDNQLKKVAVPRISDKELDKLCADMIRQSRLLPGPNDDNWGLAADVLKEQIVVKAGWETWPVVQGALVSSRPFPPVPARFDRSGRLEMPAADDGCYLSIIANVREGETAQHWCDELVARCAQRSLAAEVILVEGSDEGAAEARNAAAQRTTGRFLLFTRAGTGFSDDLLDFLAERRLDPDCFYRIDASTGPVLTSDPQAAMAVAGCEDFLLMARARFVGLRGFPQIEGGPARSAALLLHMAHAEGLSQILLHPPFGIVTAGTDATGADEETQALDRLWCAAMMRQRRAVTPNLPFAPPSKGNDGPLGERLVEFFSDHLNRVYFREQTAQRLDAMRAIADELRPDRIVEFGIGYGLSLRVWAGSGARIVAVDPDLSRFREGLTFAPFDTTGITLIDDALDRIALDDVWGRGDDLLVVINPHLLSEADRHLVWTRVLPRLPAGCRVIVSPMWLSPHRLDERTIYPFFANSMIGDIDPTYTFDAGYLPFSDGGSIVGVGDVRPLVEWLVRNRVEPHVPDRQGFVVFDAPKEQASEPFDMPEAGRYLYNPANNWHWQEGEFADPLARHIRALCDEGAGAYRADDIARAEDRFTQAMQLYWRMTWTAQDSMRRMIEADERGDRDAALQHFQDCERTIRKSGLLKGARGILIFCALRCGDLKGALAVPLLSYADFVSPDLLDAVRMHSIRSGGRVHGRKRDLEIAST